jgi:glycosyltransferase involved in cell wall biosynthesis
MAQPENLAAKLSIYILCHNRPDYAKLAIDSVLSQTNQNFRLVISDNSSNDELYRLIKTEFPGLEIRRRIPSIPSTDHFNKCISEVNTDYFCLFHDDDLMEPGYVDAMLKTIERHPYAVAYSCNAVIINENNVPTDEAFDSRDSDVVIENPRSLAGRYFSRHPNGIAPFPAYIYRSDIAKAIPINPDTGGKYSDVTWLLEISKCGSFVWNSEKLIRYRMHSTSDGGFESTRDRLKLLGYLKLNILFLGQGIIDDYRFFLYKKLRKTGLNSRQLAGNLSRIIKRYMVLYRLRRFFKYQTYAYLNYKLGKAFSRKH